MLQIKMKHIQNVHDFWLAVYESQHNNAERILQLCVFIKLIQNHIGICVFSEFNNNSHTLAVRFIAKVCNAVYFL